MLVNVQFLRFVAAMLVVLSHAAAHLRLSGHDAGLLFGIGHLAGFAGVDIFFVISGFIMAWTTFEQHRGAMAWSFFRRRAARIYSGYWPFFLVALMVFSWLGGAYLANKSFVSSWFLWPTSLQHLVLPVSWTLIFEMVFYSVFTLLLLVNPGRRLGAISVLMLMALAWTAYSHFVAEAYEPGQLEQMSVYEQYLFFPYWLEFLGGAMLAYVLRNRSGRFTWVLLTAGIIGFLMGGWVNENYFNDRLIQGYYIFWRVLVFGVPALLLVSGLVLLEARGTKILPRFSLLAGGSSYAIYLSHTIILAATHHLGFDAAMRQFSAWQAQALFLALIGIIVIYSMIHYRWLERPLHKLFRRVLGV